MSDKKSEKRKNQYKKGKEDYWCKIAYQQSGKESLNRLHTTKNGHSPFFVCSFLPLLWIV
jgi:hypothetical protein